MNGLCFATMASRVPDLRTSLGLSNGSLGLLLLSVALGSMIGMPASGHLIERLGADAVVRLGSACVLIGLVVAGIGAAARIGTAGRAGPAGCDGFGTGTWDVAMNVEGAGVERLLGRSIMPRFHAGWSLGTFTGAGIGAVAAAHRPAAAGALPRGPGRRRRRSPVLQSRAFPSVSEPEPAETESSRPRRGWSRGPWPSA